MLVKLDAQKNVIDQLSVYPMACDACGTIVLKATDQHVKTAIRVDK